MPARRHDERILYYTRAVIQDRRGARSTRRWTGCAGAGARDHITSAATTCFWRDCRIKHHRHARARGLHRRSRALAARARRRGRHPRRVSALSLRPRPWRQAEQVRVPRMVYVNKMDRVGADLLSKHRRWIKRPTRCPPGAYPDPPSAARTSTEAVDLNRPGRARLGRKTTRRWARSSRRSPSRPPPRHVRRAPGEDDRGARRGGRAPHGQ